MSTERLTQSARAVLDAWGDAGWTPAFDAARRALRAEVEAAEALAAVPVEPVAWSYELFASYDNDPAPEWKREAGIYEPACNEYTRNIRPLYTHPAPQPQRCPYCDDTGDVHSADGEWRGACACPAGASPQPTPPQQAAPEQTAKMVPAGVAFSDLFMEQFEALAGSVTSDIIKDAARLAAACAYSLAATPPQPTAPAPQAQAQPITEAEAIKLWHGDKEAHRRESAFEWYAAGLIAAQHHYGIATPASAAQKEPT